MKIYVVNLKRRPEKKIHMELQLSKEALEAEFIEAVDGADQNALTQIDYQVKTWSDPRSKKRITGGEIGCALSHWKIWNMIANSDDNHAIILEDDVMIPNQFMTIINNYLARLEDMHFDMFYLIRKPLEPESETEVINGILTACRSYWTAGYLLTQKGAKKLVKTNFVKQIIPVDEFLPNIYTATNFTCLAPTHNILHLVPNSFATSDTFHSDPIPETTIAFTIIVLSETINDSVTRLQNYCNLYGIAFRHFTTTQDVNSFLDNHFCLCLLDLNSDYDILPLAPPEMIKDKFESYGRQVLAFDSKLKIGYSNELLRYTVEIRKHNELLFILDTNSQVDITKKSIVYVKNDDTTIRPLMMASKDHKLLLNKIENYTGRNWDDNYGYNNFVKPAATSIYVASLIPINQKSQIHRMEKHYYDTNNLNQIVSDFLPSKCEYLFIINNNFHLIVPNTIDLLLESGKNVVSPMMRSLHNPNWSTFWGALDDKGYYARSDDYFDILEKKTNGCWNVPYINGVYLIHRSVLEKVPNPFTHSKFPDYELAFCANMRDHNIHMYTNNMHQWGYICHEVKEPMTLFELETRTAEWEAKYLDPLFMMYYREIINSDICHEVCQDAFQFPFFTEAFCAELIAIANTKNEWSAGSKDNYDPRLGKDYYENHPTQDVQMFQLGLDDVWKKIVDTYVAFMASRKYSEYKTKGCHLGFIVRYHPDHQNSLRPHHDASVYTINVALNTHGVNYQGGGCRFIRQNVSVIGQPKGSATMHPGRLTHYHEGLPTTSGIRYILVSFIN